MFRRASALVLLCALAGCPDEAKPASVGAPPAPVKVKGASAAAQDTPAEKPKKRPKSIVLAEAHDALGWRVAEGYLGRDELVGYGRDLVEQRASLVGEVDALVDALLAEHRERERGWNWTTDCDRLDAVFTRLEREGYFAKQNFGDCQTCAVGDLEALRDEAQEKGQRTPGFVFFTQQDVEGVVESGSLPLSYGAFADDDASTEAVGRRVVKALEGAGFSVSWNGKADERITVDGLEWKRRRFSRPPR